MALPPLLLDTAGIDVSHPGIAPAVFADLPANRVVTHMTVGFNPADPLNPTPAWNALGHVRFTGPTTALTDWDFGFIQFMQTRRVELVYAGRTRNEGSIFLLITEPPALPRKLTLDSVDPARIPGISPWTRAAPRFDFDPGDPNQVLCSTGDHPAGAFHLRNFNTQSGTDNFVFLVTDLRDLFVSFVAQQPSGQLHFLAHFHQPIAIQARVTWSGGVPTPHMLNSTVTPHKVVRGPPPVAGALLTSPVGPMFNDAIRDAFSSTDPPGAANARPPNRVENRIRKGFDFTGFFT
jgi:hypothetical protein